MTALALLIAIFRYQPSPFCILDEVDAPLDEANVGRFTRLIGDMSAQTQFIVVTHNRKTMEMGSVLYGVTMQEPGVSKLVSVRWEGDEAPTQKRKAAPPRKPVATIDPRDFSNHLAPRESTAKNDCVTDSSTTHSARVADAGRPKVRPLHTPLYLKAIHCLRIRKAELTRRRDGNIDFAVR